MTIDFDTYIKKFEDLVTKYIPPKDQWTPADYATYGPRDLYRVPEKEAAELCFNAIKYQFKRHFENNSIYHKFCETQNFSVDNLKNYDDIEKIPLIPDKFYKDYPIGRDFAIWLSNIFTGELPTVKISGRNPSFDEVINAFNAKGMVVAYSSGTSGKHTFIPRDLTTFNVAEYLGAKLVLTMAYPIWEYNMNGYLLMPNPFKTNVFAGKVCTIYFDIIKDVKVAIDREINTETIRLSMLGGGGIKSTFAGIALKRMYNKIVNNIIKWLELNQKEGNKIAFAGAPFFLYSVMDKLEKEGKTFDFSDKGAILTGGGWKVYENLRITVADFRKKAESILGIRPQHCLDAYGMVEGNGWMVHCPESHYLHVPHSYYHPMVLDEELKHVGFGEYGRFAFLDGSTFSYPGFITSGDRVKLLEHCPVCDRPGPVLEPEIKRAAGEETRGCAEEMRKMIATDFGR